MNQKNCSDCGNLFQYEPPLGKPDTRKYCDSCSIKRKEMWNAKKQQNAQQQAPIQQNQPILSPVTAKHDVVVTRSEKPNSYEFGPASARHKIYYDTIEELRDKIKEIEFLPLHSELPGQ